jgi:hypothetical protein
MREYGKIHSSFWTSQDIREAGEDGRVLAAYLLTSPHSNMLGCFRVPLAYVSDDLKWPLQRVLEGFEKLSQRVWLTFDKGSEWVVIHKFLKWNQPENPNVVRAAEKLFAQIPGSSGVKAILAGVIAEFEPRFSVDKLVEFEPFPNPFDTSAKAYRKPEPEPEPLPEPEPEPKEEPVVLHTTAPEELPAPPEIVPNNRAAAISVLMRRNGVEGCNAANPIVQEWAANAKVTDDLLLTAADMAKKREVLRPGPSYLKPIIEQLLNPPKPRQSEDAWKRTPKGIEGKASELGIYPRPGESHDTLRERCEAEIRKRVQGVAA